ncbi:zinc finger protein 540-like [Pogonomyrmex barbatus]|uniref:Zinc finger protein 540-like n=1 Tax=Pogonomyrmex barbatus TaxID=144034 RepID=A0A6I9WBI6_9HYME|nr:zinc finger protein 540-like [Pogonomyrmex barbatus]
MFFTNKDPEELRKQDLQLLSFRHIIERRRYMCGICHFQYITKMDLDIHMQRVHSRISYMCKRCNVMLKTWLKFQEHNSTIHRNLIFCPYCYKSHVNYEELKSHWSFHEPYECKLCYKTFISWRHFNDHKISTHCGQECDYYVAIMLLEE